MFYLMVSVSRTFWNNVVDSFNNLIVLYLVYLRLDEEELYESGGAFNGCVDAFEGKRLFADMVEMLRQEILNPK